MLANKNPFRFESAKDPIIFVVGQKLKFVSEACHMEIILELRVGLPKMMK